MRMVGRFFFEFWIWKLVCFCFVFALIGFVCLVLKRIDRMLVWVGSVILILKFHFDTDLCSNMFYEPHTESSFSLFRSLVVVTANYQMIKKKKGQQPSENAVSY